MNEKMIQCERVLGGKIEIPVNTLQFRPSAYAIVMRGRKLLMVRMKHTGKLFLPGGGIDLGERAEQTVVRELREEAGIEVQRIMFWDFFENFVYHDVFKTAYHAHLLVFTAELVNDKWTLNEGDPDEGKAEWVDLHTIDLNEVMNIGKTIIEDFMRDR